MYNFGCTPTYYVIVSIITIGIAATKLPSAIAYSVHSPAEYRGVNSTKEILDIPPILLGLEWILLYSFSFKVKTFHLILKAFLNTKFLDFKNGVKIVQATAYNGVRTVPKYLAKQTFIHKQ